MSGSLSNLNRRLAKVEQQMADRERQKKLATCNCYPNDPEGLGIPFVVTNTEEFEAEMNLTCPAHGFRRLGQLPVLQQMHPDRPLRTVPGGAADCVNVGARRKRQGPDWSSGPCPTFPLKRAAQARPVQPAQPLAKGTAT